jgi:hypothetical protein
MSASSAFCGLRTALDRVSIFISGNNTPLSVEIEVFEI